jgi:hypothetical protein
MDDELLDDIETALAIAQSDIARARDELRDDPTLATNDVWRDRLETSGYRIATLLSASYDDE